MEAQEGRSGSLLERLLSGMGMSPTGFLIESGLSGSLHMQLSDDAIRAALRRPLSRGVLDQGLLEPLWDSESGARMLASLSFSRPLVTFVPQACKTAFTPAMTDRSFLPLPTVPGQPGLADDTILHEEEV
jgi:hypothetical protein